MNIIPTLNGIKVFVEAYKELVKCNYPEVVEFCEQVKVMLYLWSEDNGQNPCISLDQSRRRVTVFDPTNYNNQLSNRRCLPPRLYEFDSISTPMDALVGQLLCCCRQVINYCVTFCHH